MKTRFHPEARVEYVEALVYLEERRSGYGEKFEGEVFAALEQAQLFPESGARMPGCLDLPVRKFSLRAFRYDLMVGMEGDEMVVYAVVHRHRKPGYWRGRLD